MRTIEDEPSEPAKVGGVPARHVATAVVTVGVVSREDADQVRLPWGRVERLGDGSEAFVGPVEPPAQPKGSDHIITKALIEDRDVTVASLDRGGGRPKRQATGLRHIQVDGAVDADALD